MGAAGASIWVECDQSAQVALVVDTVVLRLSLCEEMAVTILEEKAVVTSVIECICIQTTRTNIMCKNRRAFLEYRDLDASLFL